MNLSQNTDYDHAIEFVTLYRLIKIIVITSLPCTLKLKVCIFVRRLHQVSMLSCVCNKFVCQSSRHDGYLRLFLIGDYYYKVSTCKGANIRNRDNQVPHLTQDTNGKVTNSKLDTTKESQGVSKFPSR